MVGRIPTPRRRLRADLATPLARTVRSTVHYFDRSAAGGAATFASALLVLLVGWLASGSATPARYRSLEPFELALMADLIVDGTIVGIGAHGMTPREVFTVRINAILAGEAPGETLQVVQFIDWTCASRYAPYEEGQRALFHLEFSRDEKDVVVPNGPLQVLGAGNEGECPVVEERLFHRPSWNDVRGEEHSVFGHRYFCVASSKAEYTEAIVGLRSCYRWTLDPKEVRESSRGWFYAGTLRQLCSDDELAAFAASSDIAKRLVTGVRKHQAAH